MNPHLLLGAAVVAELVGTTALKLSEGFSRALPTAGVLVGYGLGFYLLALVLEDLPVGLVYATRAALGVVGVAVIGALGFGEQVDLAGLVLGLIVAGVYVVTAVSGRAGYAVCSPPPARHCPVTVDGVDRTHGVGCPTRVCRRRRQVVDSAGSRTLSPGGRQRWEVP